MNFFELFEIPERPIADGKAVDEKYFALQKSFHPDFHTEANEAEQEEALAASADVNAAYAIFRDPQKTLEYFLRITGSITPDEKFDLPPDFLMEMMELNEAFEEEAPEVVEKRAQQIEESIDAESAPWLDWSAPEAMPAEGLAQLKSAYYRKKYLRRILDRIGD